MDQNNKNEFAKHISLFLAELLRTRRITLVHAAEIAQKVLDNINLIDNEEHFLKFVKQLTLDFNVMVPLVDRAHKNIQIRERQDLEQKVRNFVVSIMATDMELALQILNESIKEEAKLSDLYAKFPKFKEYYEVNIHG